MDSFELNKIIAAILMVALLIIGIGKLSDVIFHVEKPKTPGYSVEIEQATVVSSQTSSQPTEDKVDIINHLIKVGFQRIEVSSFVSPKAIPQLADAATILENEKRNPKTTLAA